MRELFDISELVQIGLEDEISGVAFYSALAEQTSNPSLRTMFADLAQQEKYHKMRFEEILVTLGASKVVEEYPGQYMAYLRTMTDGRAFPDAQTAIHMAQQCADDAEALDLASRFERDTLILMNEMKGLVPPQDRDIVNELIREEQSHLVTLAQARKHLR